MGEAVYKGILYVNVWDDNLLWETYLFFVFFLAKYLLIIMQANKLLL